MNTKDKYHVYITEGFLSKTPILKLGTADTLEEATDLLIKKAEIMFVTEILYTRHHIEENEEHIDFGSYKHFGLIRKE